MQLDRLRDRVPPAGADAGSDQRAEGVGGDQFGLARVAGDGIPAVGGGRVVVRDQLHDLTDPVLGDLLQPLGDVGVAARPLRRGQRGVRDVAQQRVLERELHLPGEAGRRAGQDQAAVLQGGERVGDVVAETAAQRLDPEHPAHHGRRLQQPLLGYRQRVDARGQQRVEGVGQRAGPAVGHVRDQLLEEVRVAFRAREDLLAALRVESRSARQAVEQIPAGPLGERPQRDHRNVRRRGAEARMLFEELRPGRGEHHHRTRRAGHQPDQHVQQRLSGPVQVLDDHDERPARRRRRGEARPGLRERVGDGAWRRVVERAVGHRYRGRGREREDRVVHFGLIVRSEWTAVAAAGCAASAGRRGRPRPGRCRRRHEGSRRAPST